jgi:5-dehydro-2-deoxygluconokinase
MDFATDGSATKQGTPPFDVITMGRVSVDLYPEQVGVPLSEVRTFSKSLGGSTTNVAVAAARLGLASAAITKVGDDGFGSFVRTALAHFGVDASFVGTDPDLRTPLVFCEVHPPDHFPLLFYREPRAPDINLGFGDLPLEQIVAARLFWTSGTGLSQEPSRSATLAALDARAAALAAHDHAGITIHDLDYRPSLWGSREQARSLALEAVRRATVVVGNEEEVGVAVDGDPYAATQALVDLGVKLAVCKRGGEGLVARTADGAVIELPAISVDVVNGLGAGDAFGGALCFGLLSGWEVERALRFASAGGAIVASRMLCADAMPAVDEIEALLAGHPVPSAPAPANAP